MDRGIAGDTGHGTKRLLHRLSQRDADVLGGVVIVDMKIAIRLDRDVDPRMPGQQIEHMVEEADPGRNLRHTRTVEVHRHLDVGLLGLALDRRRAHEMPLPLSKTRVF